MCGTLHTIAHSHITAALWHTVKMACGSIVVAVIFKGRDLELIFPAHDEYGVAEQIVDAAIGLNCVGGYVLALSCHGRHLQCLLAQTITRHAILHLSHCHLNG